MAGSKTPEYLGEPTLAQVMRRPQWILALLLALAVAAGFALLAQWQGGAAIKNQALEQVDTETPRPLVEVASASKGVTDTGAEVVVLAGGEFMADDFVVVTSRMNGGVEGAWVVGNLLAEAPMTEAGAHLAVAIGWAPTAAAAQAAADRLASDPELLDGAEIEGRYMIPEAPQVPRSAADPQQLTGMIPAQLANVWSQTSGPVYSGFLVLHPQASGGLDALGLDTIDSMPPLPPEAVNWLNVFYAIEWLVFGGFAIFFWYRLSRDAWEKEHELQLLEAGAAAPVEVDEDISAESAALIASPWAKRKVK